MTTRGRIESGRCLDSLLGNGKWWQVAGGVKAPAVRFARFRWASCAGSRCPHRGGTRFRRVPLTPGGLCVSSRKEQGHRIFTHWIRSLAWVRKWPEHSHRPALSPFHRTVHVLLSVVGTRRINKYAFSSCVMERSETSTFPGNSSLSWAADGNALFAAAVSTEYLIVRIELDGRTSVLLKSEGEIIRLWLPPARHPMVVTWRLSQETYESNLWLLENF